MTLDLCMRSKSHKRYITHQILNMELFDHILIFEHTLKNGKPLDMLTRMRDYYADAIYHNADLIGLISDLEELKKTSADERLHEVCSAIIQFCNEGYEQGWDMIAMAD
jgi:hypothetical protein